MEEEKQKYCNVKKKRDEKVATAETQLEQEKVRVKDIQEQIF